MCQEAFGSMSYHAMLATPVNAKRLRNVGGIRHCKNLSFLSTTLNALPPMLFSGNIGQMILSIRTRGCEA
jgi:hypothetical protein